MYSANLLGARLKTYRKRRGFTQHDIAERLFVTEQVVSKWETGRCYPDVQKLCALATSLGVSVDALLESTDDATEGRLFIGIDGGATKTDFCLCNERGEVLMQQRLGGTSPNIYGLDATLSVLKTGIDLLMALAVKVEGLFAGISGCGLDKNRKAVFSRLSKLYPDMKIEIAGDIINTVYSTPYSDNCIATIVGTGSVIYVKEGEGLRRIGGWGYLYDRNYNGYYLGSEVVRAVLAEEDGIGEATVLSPMLEELLGGKATDNIDTLFSKTKDEISSFAPLLFYAYDKGDLVAKRIVSDAAALFSDMLKRALEASSSRTVIVSGGLTARKDILLENLTDIKDVRYIFPEMPSIYGACNYCVQRFGNPKQDFDKVFIRSYDRR